tara:strand:+ start:982 stop:1656 length:675 start_codon:yes stop_codon:yes gene_type:complete
MAYQGSPNSYFKQLPELDYPSLRNDRTSAYDYEIVKNLFKRAVMRDDVYGSLVNFEKYSVKDDERPDQVAYDFYNDSNLDWVILTTNNIVHVRDEWPMGSQDFLTYLNDKYTAAELTNIHHYETKVIRDAANNLIQPAGIYVDSDHSITYVDRGVTTTKSEITSVTFLENETNMNDKKRNINIMKRELLDTFFRDINNIMTYKESNQFITEKLKVTENPRLISP